MGGLHSTSHYQIYGTASGNYHHRVTDDRQFIYKICVRSGSLIDGIQFFYFTPNPEMGKSAHTESQSPWYGGYGGILRCFEVDDYGGIAGIDVKSGFYVDRLRFQSEWNKFSQYYGGNGGDTWASFSGSRLKSVEVWDGNIYANHNYINGLRFHWHY